MSTQQFQRVGKSARVGTYSDTRILGVAQIPLNTLPEKISQLSIQEEVRRLQIPFPQTGGHG